MSASPLRESMIVPVPNERPWASSTRMRTVAAIRLGGKSPLTAGCVGDAVAAPGCSTGTGRLVPAGGLIPGILLRRRLAVESRRRTAGGTTCRRAGIAGSAVAIRRLIRDIVRCCDDDVLGLLETSAAALRCSWRRPCRSTSRPSTSITKQGICVTLNCRDSLRVARRIDFANRVVRLLQGCARWASSACTGRTGATRNPAAEFQRRGPRARATKPPARVPLPRIGPSVPSLDWWSACRRCDAGRREGFTLAPCDRGFALPVIDQHPADRCGVAGKSLVAMFGRACVSEPLGVDWRRIRYGRSGAGATMSSTCEKRTRSAWRSAVSTALPKSRACGLQ